MKMDEVEFEFEDGTTKSLFDLDWNHPWANLHVGDEVTIERGDRYTPVETDYVVTEQVFGDYNIRGSLQHYKLKRI